MTERAETIKLGDPADVATEMGPAASDAQRDRIIAMIEQARAEVPPSPPVVWLIPTRRPFRPADGHHERHQRDDDRPRRGLRSGTHDSDLPR